MHRPLKNDSIKARQVQEADKQLLKIKRDIDIHFTSYAKSKKW